MSTETKTTEEGTLCIVQGDKMLLVDSVDHGVRLRVVSDSAPNDPIRTVKEMVLDHNRTMSLIAALARLSRQGAGNEVIDALPEGG